MSSSTVQKALDILFLIAQTSKPLTVQDIALQFDKPVSSIYRVISTLKLNGMVEKKTATSCWESGV